MKKYTPDEAAFRELDIASQLARLVYIQDKRESTIEGGEQ